MISFRFNVQNQSYWPKPQMIGTPIKSSCININMCSEFFHIKIFLDYPQIVFFQTLQLISAFDLSCEHDQLT
jgi:hypothetical protein